MSDARRTITTAKELIALSNNAIIRTSLGNAGRIDHEDGHFHVLNLAGSDAWIYLGPDGSDGDLSEADRVLPALVLWEGGADE